MNALQSTIATRMNWIDWLKAIGMFLIVLGHTFPPFIKVVYAFSVPLLFIMSGFLTKQESDNKIFWKKIWYNLIIPCIIFTIITFIYTSARDLYKGQFEMRNILLLIPYCLIGSHKFLGGCWFIYTLIIAKVLYQFTPPKCKNTLNIFILILFTGVALAISYYGKFFHNAGINIFISYPFFLIGVALSHYKEQINKFCHRPTEVGLFLLSAGLLFVSAYYNSGVWVYKNDFGGNILLYYLGGISGTLMVAIFCKWLNSVRWAIIQDIAVGSIIILGLHFYLIAHIRRLIPNELAISIIIMLLFIPIIRFCKKHCPIVIGSYRLKSRKS